MKAFSRIFLFLIIELFGLTTLVEAQRKMEQLDRGVVAVRNASSSFFISWRYLATDADDLKFNLYAKNSGAGSFTKLNATPLSVTNYSAAAGALSAGALLYVTTVLNGVEGVPSGIFTIPSNGLTTYRSAYLDIAFSQAADGLDVSTYSMKFCWPVDLDGDGEYDFVVDRLSTDGGTHKVQAYLRNGTLLWTIDMGPNVSISQGQDDMVLAYDMDGDGKGEVVVKSSDGTKFSDGKYVKGSTTGDTDNDGIINYETQTVRNAPQYITVINGLTGVEKSSIEMAYPSNYTRTNKANFMGDGYYNLNGHMAILYLDGKHPSVGFIYKTRTVGDQYHWYAASAYGYDARGNLVNWYNWERGTLDAAEGHSIRVADVDLDGRDELLDIGYGIKYDGTVAFNAHISHGDRFRVGDIDPDRPGLETYAIQQNASSMLGQIVYESATGSAIKKYYMSGVGDVGRGECMDVDSTRQGYEFWSTMANIYDAKGDIIYEGSTPFPFEGIWWDGDLGREELAATDGDGFNADVRKYSITGHSFGSRLIEFAKMTNWQVKSSNGVRPAFFGDIAGDWREEVVLEKVGTNGTSATSLGFVAFSTDYPTTYRQYCLMQDPAYRMQATTKGYYQSPMTDFYMGYRMPTAPVPPVLKAKLTWSAGTNWNKSATSFKFEDEKTASSFADGDDVLFDISGDNTQVVQLPTDLAPSKLLAMNPKGHDYTISGAGKLTGTMSLLKSMQGTFTLNGSHTYTGKTSISEGTLLLNGTLDSPVTVMAKGTLGGNAVLNGSLTVQPGLNIEGGRLSPGNGLGTGKLGKITVNGNLPGAMAQQPPPEPGMTDVLPVNALLVLPGNTNLAFDVLPSDPYKNDSLLINGDLQAYGVNNIVINTESGSLPAGTYSLIKWTGSFTGSVDSFAVKGISGLPLSLIIENSTLKLVVNATRSAGNVLWSGQSSGVWDFKATNFSLSGEPTYFVSGDRVDFNDEALVKSVTLSDLMTTSKTVFSQDKGFLVKGTGGIAGSGNLEKTGKGLLDIQNTTNTYTGKTLLSNASVQVASLAEAGTASSLGAASVDPANLSLTDSRLFINAVNVNTDRGLTLLGSDTINMVKSNGIATVTGLVTGAGKLVKEGPGQLNLSGSAANTYAGGTVINGSTLALGSLAMNTSGLGTGPISLENAGVLSMYYSISDYNQKPIWDLTVPTGQTGSLLASGRCAIGGTLSGGGTLQYDVPYYRADLLMNCTNFTGTLQVTTDADGGDFRITANSNGLPNCNVDLSNLVYMGAYSAIGASSTSNSTVVKIGSLAGIVGSKLGGGTWQIGNNNSDAVYNGVINDGATITKIGTGSWTLTGANLCTSTFTVSGGRLIVANATGSATGTSAVVVSAGGTLSGSGTIVGNTTVNGTLEGNVNFGGNLTMTGTTNLTINGFTAGNYDVIDVVGTVTNGGTLNISINAAAPVNGTTIKLINATTYSGNFATINCPEGYSYNAATGVLTCTGYAWAGTGTWSTTTNWRNGSLPPAGAIILVESGLLTINQNVSTGNFLQSSGSKVTISSGSRLTVAGTLTLQSTATLVDNNLTNGLAVSSGTTVQQFVSGLGGIVPKSRFWYVSSPLTNATSTAFDVTSSNPINKLWSFSEAAVAYSLINTSMPLTPGIGYVARLGASKTVNFAGALPNSGDQNIPVTRTGTSNVKRGFNLVGNPYPSFVELNPTDNPGLEPTIWFRSLTTSGTNMAFDTYNIVSNVQVVASGSGPLVKQIAPMQAFWIKVLNDGATGVTVAFKNANRSHQVGVSLRSETTTTDGLRLQISNGSTTDETFIGFYDAASDDFDALDSHKMNNETPSMAEIFTLAGGEEVAINGLKPLADSKELALGYRTGIDGDFSIKLSEKTLQGCSVVLKDKLLNREQNMLLNPEYAFSSVATTSTDRFSLIISRSASNLDETASVIRAWFDNAHRLNAQFKGSLKLLNAQGQVLMVMDSKGDRTLSDRVFAPGVYVLEIIDGSSKSTKKLINR
jgi:autotransporter-associated beta strand protein